MAANGGGGRGGNGAAIPPAVRKIVQSLKEIVNCPEQEIYAILHECNMDPSETVNRLLNQDTFQEVKSKRDKKKEVKETSDSKSRGVNNVLNRGGRFGTDRGVRTISNNSSSNGAGRSKPLIKKENGPTAVSSSSVPGHGSSGNFANKQSTPLSTTAFTEAPLHATLVTAADNIAISSKPPTGYHHVWSGAPGQLSMADIVKMGRPQAKPTKPTAAADIPTMSEEVVATGNSNTSAKLLAPPAFPSESPQERHPSSDHASDISNVIREPDTAAEHVSLDSWSAVDQLPSESKSTVSLSSNAPVFSEPSESRSLQDDRLNLPLNSAISENEIYTNIDATGETIGPDSTKPIIIHDRQISVSAGVDSGSFENRDFYEHSEHAYQHCEADDNEGASSVAANLQQLSLKKEGLVERPRDNNPGVIFPENLQVNVDCSHLSFGSFGSGISANFSGSLLSKTQMSNLDVASAAAAAAEVTTEPPDASIHGGNSDRYDEEQLRTTSDEDLEHRTSTSAENYDCFSSPQPAVVSTSDPSRELQYSLTPSMPSYAFSDTTQSTSAANSYSETISPAQDRATLSNVMQAYSISLPSHVSEPAVQAGREFDLPYSPSLAQQLLVKYNSGISSLSGPAISIPENAKPSLFSMLQPASQPSASTSLQTGSTVPQHLPVPHYSQPTLSFGPLTNMIGYPYIPPSYPPYLPSAAFQQAYSGSNAYHQSPAAVHSAGIKYTLPQYKSSVSASNLPESAIMPSSYGGFGSSANLPGSFMLNPQTVSASTTLGYNDTLASHQFKDGNHYSSLQQGENSALWLQQAAGSRTMPSLPTNAFYNLQGQSQHSAFRQLQQQQQQQHQQQASQYGPPAFSNFYSHAGVSQELPQNSNTGNLNRSQGIPSQSSHQLWQSNY